MAEKVSKEVEGVVTVKDEATPVITQVNVALKDTSERAISGFKTAERVLRNFSSVLVQVSIMSFVYNLIQRRVEHVTLSLVEATERYEEALVKYGAASSKTVSAYRKMELAQKDLNRAQGEAVLNQAIFIVQTGLLAVRFVQMAVQVSNYMKSVQLASVADLIHCKILSAKVALIAAATFGVGALVATMVMAATAAKTAEITGGLPSAGTYGTYGGITIHHEPKITVETEAEIDEAYRQMSEETKKELRRHR